MSAYPPPPRAHQSTSRPGTSAMGVLALTTSLVSVIGSVVSMYVSGTKFAAYAIEHKLDLTTLQPTMDYPDELLQAVSAASWILQIAMILGMTGLMLAVTAIMKRRGRPQGMAAIIALMLGVFLAFGAMMIALWPAVAVLS